MGLEGTWDAIGMGSGWLQPGARIHVHHDRGDAEKGLGVGLEADVSWMDLQRGMDAQLHLSAVLAHEEEQLRGHSACHGATRHAWRTIKKGGTRPPFFVWLQYFRSVLEVPCQREACMP